MSGLRSVSLASLLLLVGCGTTTLQEAANPYMSCHSEEIAISDVSYFDRNAATFKATCPDQRPYDCTWRPGPSGQETECKDPEAKPPEAVATGPAWRTVLVEECHAAVRLPGSVERTALAEGEGFTLTANQEEGGYGFTCAKLPDESSGDEKTILDGSVQGIVDKVHGKLVASRPLTHGRAIVIEM